MKKDIHISFPIGRGLRRGDRIVMRYLLFPFALMALVSCTSPTFEMTPAQIASLSDEQICKYDNSYRDETKLEAEIVKRKLNCDRFFRECLSQGNRPGTQAMNFCIATLRENERLRYDNDRPWGSSGIGIYNTIPLRNYHR